LQVFTRALLRTIPQVRLVGNNVNEIVNASVALERAEEKGMDLVIVSDDTSPPVVRIQDFKKIQYEKKKAKKVGKKSVLKEMQFKANISEHDFQTKVKAIEKFLERGDKVKVVVRLVGRERENPERAEAIITKIGQTVKCKLSKVPGPMAIALLEPAK
jgi:translation initiation factor IF-3